MSNTITADTIIIDDSCTTVSNGTCVDSAIGDLIISDGSNGIQYDSYKMNVFDYLTDQEIVDYIEMAKAELAKRTSLGKEIL